MYKERIILFKLNSILKKRASGFIPEKEFNSICSLSTSEILYSLNEEKYISRIYVKDDYELYITLAGKKYLSDYIHNALAIIISLIAAVFSVLGFLKC